MKRRLIYGITGYTLAGSASGLFIYCGLSADCFNPLVQGIAPFLQLSVGMSSCVLQMTMLLLVVLLSGRRYAGMGTVAGPVIVTAAISFFSAALSPVLLGSSFGFGTVCAAVLIGPLLQLFLHLLERPASFPRKKIGRAVICRGRLAHGI